MILLIKSELKLYSQKSESEQENATVETSSMPTTNSEVQNIPVEVNSTSQSALPLQ